MKKENEMNPGWTDKAAAKIARSGLKVQTKFATGMSRLVANIPAGRLKILLLLFCVSVGGYSVYLIGDAIFSTPVNSTIKVEQIKVPKHAAKSGDEQLLSNQLVDDPTYRQIVDFKKYMDSLKVKGNPIYDSVIRARPGLLDTVQILINAYEQNR